MAGVPVVSETFEGDTAGSGKLNNLFGDGSKLSEGVDTREILGPLLVKLGSLL